MLSRHKQRDHHVRDLVVRNGGAVFVRAAHQMREDVEALGIVAAPPFLDRVRVQLRHALLRNVALAVPRQRRPVQREVHGGEAHVEVVVQRRERLVELGADVAALERVRGREDGDLGHLGRDVDDAGLPPEVGALLEIGLHLVGDDGDVGSEGLARQGKLDEL